jgi:hypothetical protein
MVIIGHENAKTSYYCNVPLLYWNQAQSRQSAKRFFSRWNWDSPTPLAAGECALTLWSGGEDTLACG